jgi:hypothetical protein
VEPLDVKTQQIYPAYCDPIARLAGLCQPLAYIYVYADTGRIWADGLDDHHGQIIFVIVCWDVLARPRMGNGATPHSAAAESPRRLLTRRLPIRVLPRRSDVGLQPCIKAPLHPMCFTVTPGIGRRVMVLRPYLPRPRCAARRRHERAASRSAFPRAGKKALTIWWQPPWCGDCREYGSSSKPSHRSKPSRRN